jgi:hypothetical protein
VATEIGAERSLDGGDSSFRRTAGLCAIVSLPLAVASALTALIAANFDFSAASDPLVILRAGPAGAGWWRASLITDLLGYYLLIVPLTLSLREWLRRRRSPSWVDLFALCVLTYSLVGAIGAAMLASVTPPEMEAYRAASPMQRAILDSVAGSYADAVYRGLWNLLEEFLAGIGWTGLGYLFFRERRAYASATVLLGIACLVDAVGSALNLEAISMPGLAVYLVLAPVWAFWSGVHLLRSDR